MADNDLICLSYAEYIYGREGINSLLSQTRGRNSI